MLRSSICRCALQTGIPNQLASIEKGCREYEEYMELERRNESQLPIRGPHSFCVIASHAHTGQCACTTFYFCCGMYH